MQAVVSRHVDTLLTLLREEDREYVSQVVEYIQEKHAGQKRASGEPYVIHPLQVAIILAKLGLDRDTVVAGLLHDILEDTSTTYQELKERFGKRVADIVEGVTKLGKVQFKDVKTEKAENYRKLLLAMAKDIRVILVKLADRLHNMKTLGHLPREKQIRIAKETMEIYVPIANRLGIWSIKTELEDLCFMFLYPAEYERVKSFVKANREQLKDYLRKHFIPVLKTHLEHHGLQAEITYRPKHLYGIWQKTIRKGIRLEDVHDILGVRVIVNTVPECYLVLGILHNIFKPVPGKFDDYISLPKPNLYQSLHTTVIGPKGKMVEVQIRTWEMHERAEKGVAAHWAYKEGKTPHDQSVYAWLKSLVESIQGSTNPSDLLENIRLELFSEEVFVFTPKGDLLVLPKGSTPVDFAYHIHTDIGHHCAGAKVNGRIVSLDYKLQNGDVVEIITSPQKKPSPEWLKFVVTSRARNKIKAFLREQQKEATLAEGRQVLESLARKLNMGKDQLLALLKEKLKVSEEDTLLLMGSGKLTRERILHLLGYKKQEEKHSDARSSPVLSLEGLGKVMYQIAVCCSPLPGEEVYGVISKGKGLVVHSAQCPNLQYMALKAPERVMKLEWPSSEGKHPVRLRLSVKDRVGILAEVTSAMAKVGANITEARTRSLSTGNALMEFTVELRDYQHLLTLQKALMEVEGVEWVQRLFT
ncbi:(p)ppGpp synthetase I, SpoT/RelA [Thermocrinis albus DSM 14484]|uniref:(P)ppGpp synthetase I, SpoT/RelA n=1 Tax=Thermocrinis albus (strain DSM 14484 / JCM 11386 / HI 11/12) TaxID=638303 RepID=D3SM28_THEAH|nr:RelA/SpoT family protein [Thermocrinis albus]ADC89808.1 (p)ppGpp synthetase I, SpoT/RelA [Thermocrinis albus DSM 14484]